MTRDELLDAVRKMQSEISEYAADAREVANSESVNPKGRHRNEGIVMACNMVVRLCGEIIFKATADEDSQS